MQQVLALIDEGGPIAVVVEFLLSRNFHLRATDLHRHAPSLGSGSAGGNLAGGEGVGYVLPRPGHGVGAGGPDRHRLGLVKLVNDGPGAIRQEDGAGRGVCVQVIILHGLNLGRKGLHFGHHTYHGKGVSLDFHNPPNGVPLWEEAGGGFGIQDDHLAVCLVV